MKEIILFSFFFSDLQHNVLNILKDPRENEKKSMTFYLRIQSKASWKFKVFCSHNNQLHLSDVICYKVGMVYLVIFVRFVQQS